MGKRKLKKSRSAKITLNYQFGVLGKMLFDGPVNIGTLRPLSDLLKRLFVQTEILSETVPHFIDLASWLMLLPDSIPADVRGELVELDPWWTAFFARIDAELAEEAASEAAAV